MIFAIAAYVLVIFVARSGIYPAGIDTMSYLYKADALLNAQQGGLFFPEYDPLRFNGVELLRYQGPVPLYFLAFCEGLSAGDPFWGYLVFIGILFFATGMITAFVGVKYERPVMGGIAGFLWFLQPVNMYTLFHRGDLPLAVCMAVFPLLIYHIERYLSRGELRRIFFCLILSVFMGLCCFDISGMIIASMIVYMFIYALANRSIIRCGIMTLDLFGGFLITGIWALPYLRYVSQSESIAETMGQYYQSIWVSLDPVNWYINGVDSVYFSAAVFIFAILGILLSKKNSQPAFAASVIFFLGTTMSAFYLLKMLPFTRGVKMLTFVPIASCLMFFGLITWKSLKKYLQIAVLALMGLDCICTLGLAAGTGSCITPEERYEQLGEMSLIADAKKITRQRLALMDLGRLGAEGAFLVSSLDEPVASAYGYGWETAATASNIIQLNRALESGQYIYLFDRCIEMGCDSVLVRLDCAPDSYGIYSAMDGAADVRGYYPVVTNDDYRLYHADTPECFGTVSRYGAIGIGSGAGDISLSFPDVEETTENDLCKYSFEELSRYRTVYLNGFTCSDYKQAEDLVKRLADSGVRVVILADGMPEDPSNKQKSFLGVYCSLIRFSNGYPELLVHGKYINTDLFAQGYEKWDTVFISGLDKVYGSIREDQLDLEFFGTKYNENIIFLAINLSYHYAMTKDKSVEPIMEECFGIDAGKIPSREVVPLDITTEDDIVTVTSAYDNVNTSVAALEGMDITVRNNLICVDKGTSVYEIKEPLAGWGIFMSLSGVVLFVLAFISSILHRKKLETLTF